MKFFSILIALLFIGFVNYVQAQGMAPSCPETAKYYAKDSINVTTFGASTVEGRNGTDFQTSLGQYFLRCYPTKAVSISKYGVGGETTGQCLLRLNKAIENKTGFFVILAGVNDAQLINDKAQSLAQTEANIREMIKTALAKKLIPILCTLQFFDDRNNKHLRRLNTIITQINGLYRRISNEEGIYLADLNRVIRRDFSLYQDFVHPNERGNRLISYVIFDTVNKIIAERFLKFNVSQNYPNPVRVHYTTVDIVMPEPDKITIKVYSAQGQLVNNTFNEYINSGKHSVILNLGGLPNGVYIYKVVSSSGTHTTSRKLIIAR